MKSKELANVLLKILGLFICLCAIPDLISAGDAAVQVIITAKMNQQGPWFLSNGIVDIVQLLSGSLIIIKSQKIAGFWFKNEE